MFHFDYPVNLLFAPGNAQPLRPGEGKTSPFTFPWEMRKRHYWIYWDSRAAFHLMLRQEWQGILRWISFCYHMGMDQYLLIPFLGGWTSINPSYFDVNYRRAIGFDTLPYQIRTHTHTIDTAPFLRFRPGKMEGMSSTGWHPGNSGRQGLGRELFPGPGPDHYILRMYV